MSDPKTSSDGETKEQVAIDLIWDLLDRNEVLPDLITAWPGINAVAVLEKLIRSFDTDAGSMPPGFAYFLLKDLRDMTTTQIVDRAARHMPASNVKKYPKTWLNLLHFVLVLYTYCKHSRSSGQSRRLDAIKRNIEGLKLDASDDIVPEELNKKKDNDKKKTTKTTLYNLSKSIQSMTSLSPESSRPSGEEGESFTWCLMKIIEQMETIDIADNQRHSVLY